MRSGAHPCEGCAWATDPLYGVCRDTSGEKCQIPPEALVQSNGDR
jgi:hypothetical protein